MPTPFSVCIELDSPATPDTYTQLFEALADTGATAPGVGPAENGNTSIRLIVDADDAPHALTLALETTHHATQTAGIPHTVTGATILTETEFDRREAHPHIPELAGLAEAAAILGISHHELDKLLPALEPHRIQQLITGPLYLATAIHQLRNERNPTH
ncbi:hypothetical protein [Streptomyces sp. NPDC001889]